LSGTALRPPQAWEDAVRSSLDEKLHHAARPIKEAASGNAESVLFADRSELIAALAMDWCSGTLRSHWWWQTLIDAGDTWSLVMREWLRAVEYVPAAFGHLANLRTLDQFILNCDVVDSRELLERLVRQFDLYRLLPAIKIVYDRCSPAQKGLNRNEPQTDSSPQAGIHRNQEAIHPSWLWHVPEASDNRLRTDQRCLLGVALMVVRAPGFVRTQSFADDVAVLFGYPGEEWSLSTRKRENIHLPNLPQDRKETPLSHDLVVHKEDERVSLALPGEPFSSDESNHSGLAALECETEYGGVFYLINLGISLNLYGDFTTPLRRGVDLSIWDFIALLGERMIGSRLREDSLWQLLSQLAGRSEEEPPGKDFIPPDHWQMTPDWLHPFPDDGVWKWFSDHDRLRLQHPAKFLVLDVPLDTADVREQLDKELDAYRGGNTFELEEEYFPYSGNEAPLDRWLGWLLPYASARLRKAVGERDDRKLFDLLCAHHARVVATPTHLDAFFSLETLPIEIRSGSRKAHNILLRVETCDRKLLNILRYGTTLRCCTSSGAPLRGQNRLIQYLSIFLFSKGTLTK
jgi:hypothetical protein